MARDENGTYSLPEGDVVSGTPITTEWGNNSLNDLKGAMTDSLSRSGKGGMQEQLKAVTGSPAAPGYSFNGNLGTGRSLDANGYIVESIGGVPVTRFSIASGIEQYVDGAWEAVSKQDAIDVIYSNTNSNLDATNVQAAIDELSGDSGGFVTLATNQTITGDKTFTGKLIADRIVDQEDYRILERVSNSTLVGYTLGNTYIRSASSDGVKHQWGDGEATAINTANAMAQLKAQIFNLTYPVGIVVSFDVNTNPGTLWEGTTWARIGEGRYRASVGTHTDALDFEWTINAGNMPEGVYQHPLTVDEMPAHSHGISGSQADAQSGEATYATGSGTDTISQVIGGGLAHNNVPPGYATYDWVRLPDSP